MHHVLFPYGVRGILPDEITLAEALQAGGYKTGLFGKWHLGDHSPYLPNEKGFDHFFGAYYSNDMQPYVYYRNAERVISVFSGFVIMLYSDCVPSGPATVRRPAGGPRRPPARRYLETPRHTQH